MNTFGQYELIKQIGVGGMAEVWLARDKEDTLCAIKRILPHLSKEKKFIEMFLDEGKIVAKFEHPNIVKVYDVGIIQGVSFMAMEFLDGGDMANILDRIERSSLKIPIDAALEIVALATDALGYAHRFKDKGVPQNIIHRDISPHNILITKEGRVCLVDFGVAKAVDRHAKTETGIVKGKLSYMSPEQVQQEEMDQRADLFSMGVVLYELLTLQTPFGRELKAVSGIIHKPAPDPRKLRPEIDESIVKLIERALEKSPDARFHSAFEMASAIRTIQEQLYPNHGPETIRELYARTPNYPTTPRVPDPIFKVDESNADLFKQRTRQNSNIAESAILPRKSKRKGRYLLGVAVCIFGASGYGLYKSEILKRDPAARVKQTQKKKVLETKEISTPPPSIEEPLFTKLLATRPHEALQVAPDLSRLEVKKVLNYRIGVDASDYLISEKIGHFTTVFKSKKGKDKAPRIDPGDPKARFNLKTTLAERRKRREESKALRKIRAERLRRKKASERRKNKIKKKRKQKLIEKAIPSGM